MLKFISIFFLLSVMLFATTQKVYFYTSTNTINDFKTLKVKFDRHLTRYGDYEFQAFSDKKSFESFLKNKNDIVLLSSSHYRQIAKKYELDALLVVKNKKSIQSRKVIVGRRNIPLGGIVATALSKKYTNKLLTNVFGKRHFTVLKTPKDIDALMAVGFGMSQFASVSKESFKLLQKTNPTLVKDMRIYSESDPDFKMLIAVNSTVDDKQKVVKMFSHMKQSKEGRSILKILDIDDIVQLNKTQLRTLRSIK